MVKTIRIQFIDYAGLLMDEIILTAGTKKEVTAKIKEYKATKLKLPFLCQRISIELIGKK